VLGIVIPLILGFIYLFYLAGVELPPRVAIEVKTRLARTVTVPYMACMPYLACSYPASN
jgi:hypothetical protein